ncbi:MAG: arsenite/tail-anchored protein-transporting ATPase, partial [Streptomyces sp.]|nr:arsenite/tail-anchored protein-transporting ATPase [Streptomyces sp.]
MTEVRTLLVTGMPGAGRTTVAAATAAGAARAGRRTLLLTPDAASLDQLLPAPPETDPAEPAGAFGGLRGVAGVRAVDGVEGLYVAGIDPTESFRAGVLDLQTRIGSLLALLGAAPLDPEELTELPG